MDVIQSKIQNPKSEVYGEFDQNLSSSQEYLRIQFSPSSVPLKQRWRNNGLSANFMADFLVTFFPSENDTVAREGKKAEIQGVICYIANELLENAMKFTADNAQQPISITLYLMSDRLIFLSTNSTSLQAKEKLQEFIHCLTHSNPDQLYLEQIEKSASEEHHTSAGLGILTMINDYSAKVGWKLDPVQEYPEVVRVTTMVQLAI